MNPFHLPSALLWHLRLLNNNRIAVSGIGIARFIPILLFAPIGGLGCILIEALIALRVPQLRNYDGFELQTVTNP